VPAKSGFGLLPVIPAARVQFTGTPFSKHSLAAIARQPYQTDGPCEIYRLARMIKDPYEVSIVLDRDYSSRFRKLLESGPIWAIDSPANREVAEEIWKEFPSRDHLDGITIFTNGKGASPEEAFIAEFDTIDMHHGVYSDAPPYTIARAIGISFTGKLRAVLSSYGFDSFATTDDGFRATRPLPSIDNR
jgi:hypothetical protein